MWKFLYLISRPCNLQLFPTKSNTSRGSCGIPYSSMSNIVMFYNLFLHLCLFPVFFSWPSQQKIYGDNSVLNFIIKLTCYYIWLRTRDQSCYATKWSKLRCCITHCEKHLKADVSLQQSGMNIFNYQELRWLMRKTVNQNNQNTMLWIKSRSCFLGFHWLLPAI